MKFSHLAAILTSIAVSLPRPETPTVFQEDFCGTHNLCNAIFQYGFPVIARDIDMSRHLDFIGTLGFVAVIAGLRSIIEGLCWFGLPCSTWIFMSRGSTKRTRLIDQGASVGSKKFERRTRWHAVLSMPVATWRLRELTG